MPRKARIHFVSLRSSLVNLPISIYGPLLERSIRPQNLAIHLKLLLEIPGIRNEATEAYVGWTGMASASSLAHFNSPRSEERGLETIEIDPQYAQGLGFSQGDVVEIGLLHDMPFAQSVATEPLSSDDWEIIEIHASHVESTLLSQVRVAKTGQEIDVWVLGRTRVRLKIVSLEPQSNGNVLLLTTNTEVSVAPKLRRPQKTNSETQSGKDITSSTKYTNENNTKTSSAVSNNARILRALPQRFILPPIPEDQGNYIVAYVSPSTFSCLFPPHESPEDPNQKFFKATYSRLFPPVDPLSSSPNPAHPPAPRTLNPGTHEKAQNEDEHTLKGVLIGRLERVPDSHVVFPQAPDGMEDWDLLRLTPTADNTPIHVKTSDTLVARIVDPNEFLAGVDDILTRCTDFCNNTLFSHSSTNVVYGVPSLLVTGRPGAGKTSILNATAKCIQSDTRAFTYTHFVDVSRYSEQPVATIKSLFRYWLHKAIWHRPSILVLDNLDKLLSVELEHADSFRTRHLTELFVSTYSAYARTAMTNSRGIILLASATSTSALHPLLSIAHVFQDVVNVKPPNKDARRAIIAHIIKGRLEAAQDIQQDTDSPLNYTALATQTEGYSALDLKDLIGRAVHQVALRASSGAEPITLTSRDFVTAQSDFVPLSLRDVKLQKSDVAWSDIGGLHETRRILRETLEWPTKYGPIFAQSPLRLRSGLLLYGFPGCGKTLLASAVAKECGLNFISVKGPEILNKYIGASEKSVRDLFERASAAKPCILFFDEFDSIAPKRGHDSTGVTDRVVNQMLTQMDGAEGLDGVYVLAATSRPDLIDSALLRPGRLDKSLFCGMPDYEERKDILEAVSQKVTITSSINFGDLAGATEGYSGADLQALVYNAHLEAVHATITSASLNSTTSDEESLIEYMTFGGSETAGIKTKAEKMALQKKARKIF
ncbi:P-loop containing nucleoside triphosphate hydrolase protein [Collybia nuda]|uniref:Peroxisomal ATPase PEX1 n=1 Tax=Collybia nuda TaxID=64659 RepID=A0A9P5XZZ2_9AGAR|nr:P-loop containing nucleoside triphosphate hydrolase protein [Collybia nuda]